jgi:hypothetical protein
MTAIAPPAVVADEPDEEASAIERMLDDGAPLGVPRRVRKSRWAPVQLQEEATAEERAERRRSARRVFRLYCFACGRSSEVSVAPARAGRCVHCGGTMVVEPTTD